MSDRIRREGVERAFNCFCVHDVDPLELRSIGDELRLSGREIVDHENVVAALEKSVGNMGADEAGASGDDDAHSAL
jgi:hypothetical protein